jgi:hypothetical protein
MAQTMYAHMNKWIKQQQQKEIPAEDEVEGRLYNTNYCFGLSCHNRYFSLSHRYLYWVFSEIAGKWLCDILGLMENMNIYFVTMDCITHFCISLYIPLALLLTPATTVVTNSFQDLTRDSQYSICHVLFASCFEGSLMLQSRVLPRNLMCVSWILMPEMWQSQCSWNYPWPKEDNQFHQCIALVKWCTMCFMGRLKIPTGLSTSIVQPYSTE